MEGDPTARLFVLTPDPARPAWFAELGGIDPQAHDRVLWPSFRDLATAIEAVVGDTRRLLGEQARYLLSELVALSLSQRDTSLDRLRAAVRTSDL